MQYQKYNSALRISCIRFCKLLNCKMQYFKIKEFYLFNRLINFCTWKQEKQAGNWVRKFNGFYIFHIQSFLYSAISQAMKPFTIQGFIACFVNGKGAISNGSNGKGRWVPVLYPTKNNTNEKRKSFLLRQGKTFIFYYKRKEEVMSVG